MILKKYARNLKHLREKILKLSQSELADKLDISQSHLSGMEHGFKTITPKMAHHIVSMVRNKYDKFYDGKLLGLKDEPEEA